MVMVAGSLILMKVRRNGARTQGNLSQGKLSQGKVAVGLLLMMMMRGHRVRQGGAAREDSAIWEGGGRGVYLPRGSQAEPPFLV